MRIMKTKSGTTIVEMAYLIVPLISKQFMLNVDLTKELLVQISVLVFHTGIHNEEYLSFVTNRVD